MSNPILTAKGARHHGDTTVLERENDKAVIAKDKLCDYLLNPVHRRGGSKTKLHLSMAYSGDDWQRLESDLRVHHLVRTFPA